MLKIKQALLALFGCCVLAACATGATAQVWPERGVRFIVPFGPGSATDVSARLVAERLQEKWGKSTIIENRPGGDSMIAINAFVSANDDHILLFTPTSNFVAHPFRYAKLSYDRERDLIPIAQMSSSLVGLAVPTALKLESLRDFVDYARANPGKLNYTAAPTTSEMAMDSLIRDEKLSLTKVPYRDVVQAANDLMTGRLHAIFSAVTIFQAGMQANAIRVLSITGDQRSDAAPGVKTAREQGYPALGLEAAIGVFGPPSMSEAARAKLAADFLEVVTRSDIVARVQSFGQVPTAGDGTVLAATIAKQYTAFAAMAKTLDMRPE